MVFTTLDGHLVNRQTEGLATHSGRRTVVTALYADVARHVGHSDPSTTAEYVRSLGHRPSDTAKRAAQLLDPTL